MEGMQNCFAEKRIALPSHRSGSFRKLGDRNEYLFQEEESTSEFDQSCVLPPQRKRWEVLPQLERWRAVQFFKTTCNGRKQKVVVDLVLKFSFRKELEKNYIIRVEIVDLVWVSDMFVNVDDCRGLFVDEVLVQFEPLWVQKEIVTCNLIPKTANPSAYFGNSKQSGITGLIGRNPTIAVNMTNTRSQQTSQQMYTCRWEREPDGVTSLLWKLNLWCPSSNNSKEYLKPYDPRRWSGSKAPRLPSDYENGNFNGLDIKPRVEWVVPASVVRAERAKWRVTIRARLTSVSSKKSWFFACAIDRRFAQVVMQHEETWTFPSKSNGQMEDSSSSSECSSSSA